MTTGARRGRSARSRSRASRSKGGFEASAPDAGEAPEPSPGLGPEAIGRVPEPRALADAGLPVAAEQVAEVPERALIDAAADEIEQGPLLEIVGLEAVVRDHIAGAGPE